jgi:hypothetical protein
MWYQERKGKCRDTANPKYQMCCNDGKVQLPYLRAPPELLHQLLFDHASHQNKNFQQNARIYNSMFAFTSPGMKVDDRFNKGKGPPTIRIQGQTCHRIGSLLPLPGEAPKFAQLYIYDTENEISNRMKGFRFANYLFLLLIAFVYNNFLHQHYNYVSYTITNIYLCSSNKQISPATVEKLKVMLDDHNVHAKSFRMARDRLTQENSHDLKLRLISERTTDGRIYNQPTVSEVAALIVGDVDYGTKRDIILEKQSGFLKRIDEFHPAYLAYQYPLIFPYGEDGFRRGTKLREADDVIITKRNRLTIMDWLSFRRIFQQFLVDGFTMMEAERLSWIRNNQSKLRVGKYRKLSDEHNTGPKQGKRVVLPATFVGGKRYMDGLYFDGMAISAAVGFPDLFITFTCNPNWPEIQRLLASQHLNSQDRPDIISRVFKIKLNELMNDLTKKHTMGKVLACKFH